MRAGEARPISLAANAPASVPVSVSISAESINVVRADGDLSAIKVQILKYFSAETPHRSKAICKLSKCQLSYLRPSADTDTYTRIHGTTDTE